jgi:hypothetical protein
MCKPGHLGRLANYESRPQDSHLMVPFRGGFVLHLNPTPLAKLIKFRRNPLQIPRCPSQLASAFLVVSALLVRCPYRDEPCCCPDAAAVESATTAAMDLAAVSPPTARGPLASRPLAWPPLP